MTPGPLDTTCMRLHVCIDDPCLILRGSPKQCDRYVAIVVLLWLCLCSDLSYHKGQYGTQVDWTRYNFEITPTEIIAKIKADFMQDFSQWTDELLSYSQLSVRYLCSYAGKANHVAMLVYTWRPFLDQIWAAVAGSRPSNAPADKVWVKQISSSLSWLRYFTQCERGTLER